MTFGHNCLKITNKLESATPKESKKDNKENDISETDFQIQFNVLDALSVVSKEIDESLKVAASKTWKRDKSTLQTISQTVPSHDWAYQTSYEGSISPFRHFR